MTREIVFDTETTGLSFENGDRLVEIGALELIDHMPTGKVYHQYINPEREVPEEVVKVHGLTYDYLKDFPTFDKIVDEWLDFVGDGILVAHNASFDINFVNYEQKQIGRMEFDYERVIDTLEIARNKFPGSRNSLDALCKRFGVDNSSRVYHGALLDAQLLSEVYLELLGGKEPSLLLNSQKKVAKTENIENIDKIERKVRTARVFAVSEDELKIHEEFLNAKVKNAIWNQ